MSAVQDTVRQRHRGVAGLVARPLSCPLLSLPLPLTGYILSVLTCYLGLAGWEAARTPLSAAELVLSRR